MKLKRVLLLRPQRDVVIITTFSSWAISTVAKTHKKFFLTEKLTEKLFSDKQKINNKHKNDKQKISFKIDSIKMPEKGVP